MQHASFWRRVAPRIKHPPLAPLTRFCSHMVKATAAAAAQPPSLPYLEANSSAKVDVQGRFLGPWPRPGLAVGFAAII